VSWKTAKTQRTADSMNETTGSRVAQLVELQSSKLVTVEGSSRLATPALKIKET